MGLGAAVANPKIIDTAVEELKAITGQKPIVTRAKKAIANFKLRAGLPIGAMVTLRGARMWEFLDRLITVALPAYARLQGRLAQGVRRQGQLHARPPEQIIFPEINYDRIDVDQGAQHQLRDDGEAPTKRAARSSSSSACRSARSLIGRAT